MVIENDKVFLCWDLEYWLNKLTKAQRPDVMIEYNDCKSIQIIYMECPSDKNINESVKENSQKCQQLVYQIRKKTRISC